MSVYSSPEKYNKSGRFRRPADIPPNRDHISTPRPPDTGKSLNNIIESILGNGQDSDRLLILALMFLLAKDGADMKLILALGYILL